LGEESNALNEGDRKSGSSEDCSHGRPQFVLLPLRAAGLSRIFCDRQSLISAV
jgi:hypothetical protein